MDQKVESGHQKSPKPFSIPVQPKAFIVVGPPTLTEHIIGDCSFPMFAGGQLGEPQPQFPVVWVFPDPSGTGDEKLNQAFGKEFGVKVGAAYYQRSPPSPRPAESTNFLFSESLHFIRNVDLSMTDEQLAASFGIQTNNSTLRFLSSEHF